MSRARLAARLAPGERLEAPPRRPRWTDHPLAPAADGAWALLALYLVLLIPAGASGAARWAALAGAAAVLALTGKVLRDLRRRAGGPPSPAPRGALARFRRNRPAAASAAVLLVIAGLCLGQRLLVPSGAGRGEEPFLSRHLDHVRIAPGEELRPPGEEHWFGTDDLGRDLFARVLRGGGISFTIGIAATFISVVIGVSWGAAAGYLGGRTDHYLMRVVDVLYGLPFLFLVILILSLVAGLHLEASRSGPVLERMDALEAAGDAPAARRLAEEEGIGSPSAVRAAVFLDRRVDSTAAMLVALGLVQWLTMARIARGQVLSLREREFVAAARTSGAGPLRVILAHIVPNLAGPVIVEATLTVPAVMLSEAFLSFLGLGPSEPETSWGALAAKGLAGVNVLKPSWWLIAYPAGAISLTLFALNLVGDGLRDAMDPRSGGRAGP